MGTLLGNVWLKHVATSEYKDLKSNFLEVNFFSVLKTRWVSAPSDVLYKSLISISHGQKQEKNKAKKIYKGLKSISGLKSSIIFFTWKYTKALSPNNRLEAFINYKLFVRDRL